MERDFSILEAADVGCSDELLERSVVSWLDEWKCEEILSGKREERSWWE